MWSPSPNRSVAFMRSSQTQFDVAGTEVLEHDQRLGVARVGDDDAPGRCWRGDEVFVPSEYVDPDHRDRRQLLGVDRAVALRANETVGVGLLDDRRTAGQNCQL